MDMKALAKSKRAHTLHHSKKHNPHQASKAPSSISGDEKPTGQQPKQKPQSSNNARSLPSNWDRYNDDFDLGSEDTPNASPSQPADAVAPKSKGADYAHLISEAKGQAQANYPSDYSLYSDDNIYNFTQDFGPMLAAKGKNLFSWIADDGFEFESKPSSNVEAPFLSLNLNALAEQLSKANLSKRLFIEADLLPLELLDDDAPGSGEDKQDPQTSTSVPTDSGEEVPLYHEPPPSDMTTSKAIPVQTSEEILNSMKQIDSIAVNSSTFQAASSEAELDMLLNSFTETKIFESPSALSSGVSSFSQEPPTKPTNFDDNIDSLLKETVDVKITGGSRRSFGAKAGQDDVSSSATHPDSKSKFLDDFDSWLDTI
ncbi:protein ECERIFERUM 16 [Andrographis paniculata]|uniref:protein ECERIFERUM 16 n=1 Tax=Andrographis paniculata TaxID=175694 RepID=UPI0021E8FC4D|nr:protein ECERIFERUM 16 [Andrographis paniculata]